MAGFSQAQWEMLAAKYIWLRHAQGVYINIVKFNLNQLAKSQRLVSDPDFKCGTFALILSLHI